MKTGLRPENHSVQITSAAERPVWCLDTRDDGMLHNIESFEKTMQVGAWSTGLEGFLTYGNEIY